MGADRPLLGVDDEHDERDEQGGLERSDGAEHESLGGGVVLVEGEPQSAAGHDDGEDEAGVVGESSSLTTRIPNRITPE